jgi:hypothetical protein
MLPADGVLAAVLAGVLLHQRDGGRRSAGAPSTTDMLGA